MSEKPIIFSGESVRAILDGRKTMTRRVMKVQPSAEFSPSLCQTYEPMAYDKNGEGYPGNPIFGCYDINGQNEGYKCPYGAIGDRLWVRRKKDLSFAWKKIDAFLYLEITDIKVERLQEISEEDAIAEGVLPNEGDCGYPDKFNCECCELPTAIFERLWDKINGKKYPWESNLWLWCISFKKI